MLGSHAQTEVQQEAELHKAPLTSVAIGRWRQLQALRRGGQVRQRIDCTAPLLSIALSSGMQPIWKDTLQGQATGRERLPAEQINSKDYVRNLKMRIL
jgi:hypothetical protein